jgi:hypothetical protein
MNKMEELVLSAIKNAEKSQWAIGVSSKSGSSGKT